MNKRYIVIPALLLIVGFTVFQTTRTEIVVIDLPTENLSSLPPEIIQQQSHLTISISTPLASIELAGNKHIEKRLQGVIDDPSDFLLEDSVQWTINLGELSVNDIQGKIGLTIPVTGQATLHGRVGVTKKNKGLLGFLEETLGFTFSETTTIAGTIHGTVLPEIKSDWSIAADIKAEINISKADADLFGKAIKISFRSEVQKMVDEELSTLEERLNTSLANDHSLRHEVTELWNSMHLSESVSEVPPIQFLMQPLSLGTSTPKVSEDAFSFVISAQFKSSVVLNDKPELVNAAPLPDNLRIETDEGISLLIPIAIELSKINALPLDVLGVSSDIEVPGGKMLINSMSITGDNGSVSMSADVLIINRFFRNIRTTIYLTGTPIIDVEQQSISFENLAFDLKTRKVLSEMAEFLVKPVALLELQKRAVFHFSKDKTELLNLANKELEKISLSLPAGIHANLSIEQGSLSKLVVDNGWLVAIVKAKGVAQMDIVRLDLLVSR